MSYKFIRGSQISFHFMKMFAQSFKRMMWMSFVFMILGMIIYFKSNADSYPFRLDLMGFYLKSLLDSLFSLARDVSFVEYDGNIVKTSNENFIIWYERVILPKLIFFTKSSLIAGIKYFIISFFTILVIFYLKGSLRARDKMIRGKNIVSDKMLKRQLFFFNLKKFNFFPYKIGDFAFPNNTHFQHSIITGGSGSGKTQMTSDIIEQIRKKKQKAVIYDRSGSFIRKFYDPQKDIILNPFDVRSNYWDIFTEISNKNDVTNIVNALIEDNKTDPFWNKSAKIITIEVINKLKRIKDNPTNKDLTDILLKYDLEKFCKFLKDTNAVSIADESSEKTIASIRSVIASYLSSLAIITDLKNHDQDFSIKDWINNNNKDDSILFISSKIDSHDNVKSLISAWLDIAILQLMNLDPEIKRTLWFILDELPSLQKLPNLQTGLAESRKYGGSFLITCQLYSQLKEIYGHNNAQSISGLCRNRVTFSTPDETTANWCSNNLGKKENISTKENLSFGANEYRDGVNISQNKELESLVIPSQIMNLKDLEFYISLSNGFPISKSKINYKNRNDIADMFLEDKELSKFDSNIKNNKSEEKPIIKENYSQKLDEERDRKSKIILDLIRSEAKENNIYTNKIFAEKFENKMGLGNSDAISKRISILATKGYIKFNKNYQDFNLQKDIKNKFGILCTKDMIYNNQTINPTHYKSSDVGIILEIENQNQIDWQDEDNLFIEEQGNNQDIVTIPTETEDLTFTEISEDSETNLSNVNKEDEFEEDITENTTNDVEEESDDESSSENSNTNPF